MSLVDQSFVGAAAAHLDANVKLGELAQSRGNTAAVRQLGGELMRTQGEFLHELQQLAHSAGWPLPASPTFRRIEIYQHLQHLPTDGFDRALLDQLATDLADTVELFRSEAMSGTHISLRAFARRHKRELKREVNALPVDRNPR